MKTSKETDELYKGLVEALTVESPLQSLYRMYLILAEDCMESLRRTSFETPDYDRRSMVRNLFAFIEGTTYCIKLHILDEARMCKIDLHSSEEIILTERTAFIRENGSLKEDKLKIQTIPNVKFTFKRASEFFRVDPPIEFSGQGWEKLQEIVSIRDRLMHPKTPKDLEVTNEELNDCVTVFDWFFKSLARLLDSFDRFNQKEKGKLIKSLNAA